MFNSELPRSFLDSFLQAQQRPTLKSSESYVVAFGIGAGL
jgi:hypothetical protein